MATGLLDLENELSCSICTDILYHPLTLLDCLHTFCGACLKEWFALQRSQSPVASNPFTCPSCRAPIRGTKHNATVNTLLEMYSQANPEKGKTPREKEDLDKIYKPGDEVLPKPRRRRDEGEDEDRRLLEEVRGLSLREVGVSSNSVQDPRSSDRRRRERSRDTRDREGRSRRPHDVGRIGHESLSRDANTPVRQVEHQSSLRSLLSVSEIDSREIEEEIMRQIVEEGLLDGIDLSNIDVSQEDEISERIAQAYRRRLEDRRRERHRQRTVTESQARSSEIATSSRTEEDQVTNRRQRDRTELPGGASRTGPPVSRPHLFEAANQPSGHRRHRRSSSQDSSVRPSSRQRSTMGLPASNNNAAARSATDLSERPSSSRATNGQRPRRLSHNDRSATEPDRQAIRDQWRNIGAISAVASNPTSTPASPQRAALPVPLSPQVQSPSIERTNVTPPTSRRNTDIMSTRASRPAEIRPSPRVGTEPDPLPSPRIGASVTVPPRSTNSSPQTCPTMYAEPNITCNRCGKGHIEYELHYSCQLCGGGHYNLCLRCYRLGRGCLHWYGFGYIAKHRYERQAPPAGYPPGHEQPHVLIGHRYKRLGSEATRVSTSGDTRQIMTNEDPAKRLEAGVFCSICQAFANTCYWKCDICNEGEWGFCNACVNQSNHCTHPLLPLTHKSTTTSRAPPNDLSPTSPTSPTRPLSPKIIPKSASIVRGPATALFPLANTLFHPLTFTTKCNICSYPIPPSHTRYHCSRCNGGNFDICTSCYHALVSSSNIAPENGHQGWRRCPSGHRMVIIGFEDRNGGQRRIVEKDLVGGLALKDEDGDDSQAVRTSGRNANVSVTPNWSWRDTDGSVKKSRTAHADINVPGTGVAGMRFPPDGGMGLRVLALWGYYPQEGVKDELMFPKNAEIREAEDINTDWFWGVYAGKTGLFPGGYGRIL
ncbi:hypothetical protein EJ05DRAFT_530218 [Pseudovirgaria hyperparasitica]|uniref:RING-type domain-containing protein n=1 Tax=Pseudovirgaria hyperparasitica TaxID=470096 RepID=A0A6A6WML6_9PEZI|nr:uncharacterized protein EJ05DRAFT_530218 [Pseudovirgaria hyperparasitica]KAF2763445.1 hypothetical protein EJ05DRAFT_530218 [Pseudovirgaria hyperparasitica]